MKLLITLFRRAPDLDGTPGEWSEWEPFCLAGTGHAEHPAEEPGTDEPERCGGPKLGWWWQQQRRAWFVEEGSE